MYRHFIIGIICFFALYEPSIQEQWSRRILSIGQETQETQIEHLLVKNRKNQRYEKCFEKRADIFRLTSFFSYLCTFKDSNNKI